EGFVDRGVRGQRFLLPRADLAGPALADGLAAAGAQVTNVVAYRTTTPSTSAEALRALLAERRIDLVTLASASTARNLVGQLDGRLDLLDGVRVVSIGPVTSRAARELGLSVDAEAARYTIDGLVDVLVAKWPGWRGAATPAEGGGLTR